MRRKPFMFVVLCLLCLMMVIPVQAQTTDNTITGIINRDPRFSLFASVAETAGLADDLAVRSRTYTLFAPTNNAVRALANSLGIAPAQLAEDRALVRRIVQYHILGGEFSLGRTLQEEPLNVFTFSNDPMTVEFVDNRITINQGEAVVLQPNLFADNGVIHVIDRLLLPPGSNIEIRPIVSASGEVAPVPAFPPGSVLQVASTRGNLSTFVNAVVAAGLVDALNGDNLTVFAPTDGAFQTLLNDLGTSRQTLLSNTDLLTGVLTYHVVPQRYNSGDLLQIASTSGGPTLNGVAIGGSSINATIPTLNGNALPIAVGGATISLNNRRATVQQPNIQATNGVIHVIDNVLLP